MNRISRLALAAAASAFPIAAFAAAPAPHVRGTVSSIGSGSMVVHTDDGQDVTLALTDSTKYIDVTKSSLSAVDKNSYIGTATKDVGSQLVALEVVVFPNSMKGAGEGHYGWDPLPDTTLGGKSTVSSTMTNGTVSSTAAAGGKVDTTMTNGTVSTDTSHGGAKQITVTYKGGVQHIVVPPTAPIVKLAPGSMSDVKVGSHVVVTEAKDASTPTAAGVAVGLDGVTPPM